MFKIGTHLVARRLAYTHHGIYIGNNEVIHYSGFHKPGKKGKVTKTTLSEFVNGDHVEEYKLSSLLKGKRFAPEEIVRRAKSKINEDSYNLIFNNCEHFANWCTNGEDFSSQTCGTVEFNVRKGHCMQAGGLTIFDVISPFKSWFKK